jgi:hypothetical protein
LTITADNQNSTYGGALPTLTASYSGYVNGDSSSSLTTLPTVVSGTAASANAGTYTGTLTASGAVDNNYAIAYVPGTLTIGKAALTITADNQSKMYGDKAALGTSAFTDSGLFNGDVVTGVTLSSAGSPAAAPVAGSPYAITPSDAQGSGLSNYVIVYKDASVGLTVSPVPSGVSPAVLANSIGGGLPFFGHTTAVLESAFCNNGSYGRALAHREHAVVFSNLGAGGGCSAR